VRLTIFESRTKLSSNPWLLFSSWTCFPWTLVPAVTNIFKIPYNTLTRSRKLFFIGATQRELPLLCQPWAMKTVRRAALKMDLWHQNNQSLHSTGRNKTQFKSPSAETSATNIVCCKRTGQLSINSKASLTSQNVSEGSFKRNFSKFLVVQI